MKHPQLLIKTKVILISLTLILQGCTGMHSEFACNEIQGLSTCTSMQTVNQMANEGNFNSVDKVYDKEGKPVAVQSSRNKPIALNTKDKSLKNNVNAQNSKVDATSIAAGTPLRFSESVQRIWIAAWTDTKGNYHEPSYLDIVTQPGHWLGNPPAQIN